MSWLIEFGPEYDVPAKITEKLADISWHNDAAPCFCNRGDEDRSADDMTRLWVEHPDPKMREIPSNEGKRFVVTIKDDLLAFETDDIDVALAKMENLK